MIRHFHVLFTEFPHLYSRKWFQFVVLIVILYVFIKTLFLDRKVSKYDPRFASFENLKIWTKYHSEYFKFFRSTISSDVYNSVFIALAFVIILETSN